MDTHNDARDIDTVVVGTEVYDGCDGGKMGVVGEVGSDYLRVERGLLSTRKFRMPTSDVARVGSGGFVHLSVPKGQITGSNA